ncbi:MAG: tRNA 5-hydroxyuridine modification protein YegQ [Pseudomonadales bacterium]|nr:tRNA 5-hydroxyuridine modification protein YegQ [Pseudomonadales bacterium]
MTELLSPAGSLKSMRFAYAYGADAVYAGQPRYSLRVRNNEFNLANLAVGIEEAHRQGKLFYLVNNIAPHNGKVKTFMADLEPIIELGPDALIMSDPGLIMMVRERWPEVPVHLSVQSNVVNFASVKFWQQLGVKRIILSRELSLDEIKEIRQECPDIELELFVHGALCIAYSGRCLLSGYINHRDSNQGACTNACRWKYQAHDAEQTASGDIIAKQSDNMVQLAEPVAVEPQLGAGPTTDEIYLLQEAGRADQYMPAFEDEHGTYIMNSKDLRAIQHVQQFVDIGIDSLKIEGRTKSHYYAARTAQLYRRAIDDATQNKPFDMTLMDDLEKLASRGYTEGFYRRHVHDQYQNYEQGNSTASKQQFVGEIIDRNRDFLTIEVKNRFSVGDSLELMTPSGNRNFELTAIENLRGEAMQVAPGSGHQVRIPVELDDDSDYCLLMRNFA